MNLSIPQTQHIDPREHDERRIVKFSCHVLYLKTESLSQFSDAKHYSITKSRFPDPQEHFCLLDGCYSTKGDIYQGQSYINDLKYSSSHGTLVETKLFQNILQNCECYRALLFFNL